MENYLRVVRKVAYNMGFELIERDGGWNVTFVDTYGNEFDMFMFDLGLNTSLSSLKVTDKARCYEILDKKGIRAVPHYFYMYPNSTFRTKTLSETMSEMNALLETYGEVVIKTNSGGAGIDVHMITNEMELDNVAVDLFYRKENIAVSPLLDFDIEYRVVVLDGEVMMSFGKKRGSDFRHNLSAGSSAVDVPEELRDELHRIAVDAAKAVGARFVSVDVVGLPEGLMVLEINGTVTLKRIAGMSEIWFDKCVNTYECALRKVVDAYYEEVYSR